MVAARFLHSRRRRANLSSNEGRGDAGGGARSSKTSPVNRKQLNTSPARAKSVVLRQLGGCSSLVSLAHRRGRRGLVCGDIGGQKNNTPSPTHLSNPSKDQGGLTTDQ